MIAKISEWFNRLPYTNTLDIQSAKITQGVIIGLIWVMALATITPFLAPVNLTISLLLSGTLSLNVLIYIVTLYWLRTGKLKRSLIAIVWSLLVLFGIVMLGIGIFDSEGLLVAYSVPITLSGLLIGRRMLVGCILVAIATILTIIGIKLFFPQLYGWAKPVNENYVGIFTGFVATIIVLALIIERVGHSFKTALQISVDQQQELAVFSANLEHTVQERTQQLELTLQELKIQSEQQQYLIDANAEQRNVIRSLSVPILPVGINKLVLPLIGELDDQRMNDVQNQVLTAVVELNARYMIIDITGISMIDTITAKQFIKLAQAIALLGAEAVLVGIRPDVAQSLVIADINLALMRIYATLEAALDSLT